MTQLEYLEEAVRLKKANPEAEVHVCVSADEILDDFGWMDHRINRVELGLIYDTEDEMIYTDIEDVIDHMENSLGRVVSEQEAIAQMRGAILIYTAP